MDFDRSVTAAVQRCLADALEYDGEPLKDLDYDSVEGLEDQVDPYFEKLIEALRAGKVTF